MNFRKPLEDYLTLVERFKGVVCIEEIEEAEFFGYRLGNLFGGAERAKVYAGLILDNGVIVGAEYRIGNVPYRIDFATERFMDEMDFSIQQLVETISNNRDIGCAGWIKLRFENHSDAIITSREVLGEKPFRLKPVLLDTGFAKVFADLFFATVDGQMIASVANVQKVWASDKSTCLSMYECVFKSKSDGNRFFREVRDSNFVSKKGNVVYKLNSKLFLENFHSVDGPKFVIEE